MKKIRLVTTGGTIASRPVAGSSDVTAQLSGSDLAALVQDRVPGVTLDVDDFLCVGSSALSLDSSFSIAQRIAQHVADADCDGVVVTHGTDTMEESAFLADLVVPGDKPVVFTGAQRSSDDPDGDGPRNLATACRLAASDEARGLGVLLAFEDDFHAARDVTKTHTSRTDTFRSGEHGKLGEVDGDTVVVYRRPVLRANFPATRVESRVALIKMALGEGGDFLRFAAQKGYVAAVIEAFGRGNPSPDMTRAVEEAVAGGMSIIIASRCPEGRVKPVYGNGGGKDAERAGALFSGDLTGVKARVLASVVLGLPDGKARLAEALGAVGR